MENKSVKEFLLVAGVVVAILVVVLINSAFLINHSADLNGPAQKASELAHRAVPNLIFSFLY